MDQFLGFLSAQGPILLYVVLGGGAMVENLFPPVPADTFVLLGGFLAAQGHANPRAVFLATWLANSAGALLVYATGIRYGRPFFQVGAGRFLLNRSQLQRLHRFYDRFGLPAIFLARFLPGLRAMVPVFAGVTRQRFWVVALPVFIASAIWYGGLVWLGSTAGRNLDEVRRWLADTNQILLIAALMVFLLLVVLWFWSRGRGGSGTDEGDGEREGGGEGEGPGEGFGGREEGP